MSLTSFDALCDNLKAELQTVAKDLHTLPIWKPHKILHDKRVVGPTTYRSYPYE